MLNLAQLVLQTKGELLWPHVTAWGHKVALMPLDRDLAVWEHTAGVRVTVGRTTKVVPHSNIWAGSKIVTMM